MMEYHKVALREAVINAIVHNDYTTEVPPVFEIYSNRIEITSTGGISTIKNLDDFFDGYSKPINRELMRVYKDLELVEHLGSGLHRILTVYGKASFKVTQNFMKNIFMSDVTQLSEKENGGVHGGANGGVNGLFNYIKTYPNLRSKQLSEELNISLRTIERWIKQLKDEDKVEFLGASKTGGYYAKN